MFLFMFKDHIFDHVSLWRQCIVGYYVWANLFITRRVIKADYGRIFGHLDVLTITNSLLSNVVVTRVGITSV